MVKFIVYQEIAHREKKAKQQNIIEIARAPLACSC